MSYEATREPRSLLYAVFRHVVPLDPDDDYRPLYRLCLASRRFSRVAQPLLWEVISIEVLPKSAQTFVAAAKHFGQYTRLFELTAAPETDDGGGDLAEFMPALREMRELQMLQLDAAKLPMAINLGVRDFEATLHKMVPLLLSYTVSNLRAISFPEFPFHAHIDAGAPDAID
ncbi:hypothetical protein JCM3770_002349 [Rhodotorula araucariae]